MAAEGISRAALSQVVQQQQAPVKNAVAPAKQDNDGDEARESASVKATEAQSQATRTSAVGASVHVVA